MKKWINVEPNPRIQIAYTVEGSYVYVTNVYNPDNVPKTYLSAQKLCKLR